jgi:hypothetical protein
VCEKASATRIVERWNDEVWPNALMQSQVAGQSAIAKENVMAWLYSLLDIYGWVRKNWKR